MERMEMVEKIRTRANISVEEARDVLERNNWDMLDAMIELERAGKIREGAAASTKAEKEDYVEVVATVSGKEEEKVRRQRRHQNFKVYVKKFFRILIDNKFVISKQDEEIVRVPVLVPTLCLLSTFPIAIIGLIIGMICGLRYSFEGKEFGKASINEKMMRAGDYAQNIVNDFVDSVDAERAEAASEKKEQNVGNIDETK